MQLLHHMVDPLDHLLAHTGHIPVNLGRGVRNRNSQNTGIAGMGVGSDLCLEFCEGFVHMH